MTNSREFLTDEQAVGEKMRTIRKARKMTQEKLAEEISDTCSGKVISRYENGTDKMGMLTFFDVCAGLKVTPNDLAPDWLLQIGKVPTAPEGYEQLTEANQKIIRQMVQALLLQQSSAT